MLIDTRYFGEIDMDEKKIVHFEHGLFGFEEYKDYTILYDSESERAVFLMAAVYDREVTCLSGRESAEGKVRL